MGSLHKILLIGPLFAWGGTAVAAEKFKPQGKPVIDAIYDFFEKNKIMGRRLDEVTLDHRMVDGKVSSDISATHYYHGLERTEIGLRYYFTFSQDQKNYDLDDAGKRVLPPRDVSRTIVYLCEVVPVYPIVKANGVCRYIVNTAYDPVGYIDVIKDIRVEDGKLIRRTESGIINACFGERGSLIPCGMKNREILEIVDGKLKKTGTDTKYKIDETTLEWSLIEPKGGVKNPETYIQMEK